MPKDIDEILDSMFKNGRLHVRGKDARAEAETAEKAIDRFKEAQGLVDDADKTLKEMEARLKRDGVERPPKNAGDGKNLEEAFAVAAQEARAQVLGQEEFLLALERGLRRPFVLKEEEGPLGRLVLLGAPGTGRHTALRVMLEALGRRGVFKSPHSAELDLRRYREGEAQRFFLQDLYTALKSGAPAICFSHAEAAAPGVRSLLGQLFARGRCELPGRFKEQKGVLVDVGSAFAAGAVSELSAAGRYLVLFFEGDRGRLTDTMGAAFMERVDDFCETGAFSEAAKQAIGEKLMGALLDRCKQKLGFTGTYDESAVTALLTGYSPKTGVPGMERKAERLYDALSEEKLRRGLGALSWKAAGADGVLTAELALPDGPRTVRAGEGRDEAAREEALRAVKQELEALVGLREVKEYVLSLEENVAVQRLRAEQGLKSASPSMHMIFTGNPGTGKTTVARLVAKTLKAIGALSGGQLVEVTRADLVGRYVGHTAPLTRQVIESALGGVLFIDEAYSLYRGEDDSFGLEAIDTLVKGMEDHRDALVVILAGYTREMEEFLSANSGLRSRFPNVIEFPDYTGEELFRIAESVARGQGYRLAPECEQPLTAYFTQAQRSGDPRVNGNGRMARNKVEEAVLSASRRNLRLPEAERDLTLLLPEDFEV